MTMEINKIHYTRPYKWTGTLTVEPKF